MCIASVAHLYVFPATPYQRMSIIADASQVTLLTDVAAGDAPPSPTEVMESERAPYIPAEKSVTRFHESMQDALVGANRQVRVVRFSSLHALVLCGSSGKPAGTVRAFHEK